MSQNKEFAASIANARKQGCQTYLDNMIEELEHADNKNIMVVREKLHHYRWLASKLLPMYGDKQEIIQEGPHHYNTCACFQMHASMHFQKGRVVG